MKTNVIFGPAGSGKTTLLNILSSEFHSAVIIDGRRTTPSSLAEVMKHNPGSDSVFIIDEATTEIIFALQKYDHPGIAIVSYEGKLVKEVQTLGQLWRNFIAWLRG